MNEHFLNVLESIRADLGSADYSTVVSSDQIHDLVTAVSQLTDLAERLYKRIVDLENVQNERGAE